MMMTVGIKQEEKKGEHEQNTVHDDDYRTSSMDVRKRFKIHYTALMLVWLREMKTKNVFKNEMCCWHFFITVCVMMMVTKGITKERQTMRKKTMEKIENDCCQSRKGGRIFLNVIDMELNIHSVLSRNFKYTATAHGL